MSPPAGGIFRSRGGAAQPQEQPQQTTAGPSAAERRALELLEETRAKLFATRSEGNAKIEAARGDNALLREKLLETRRTLNDKVEEVRAENRELRHKVARYERRHLMKNVDAVAHNTPGAMDDFFADVEDETPYRRFGAALREHLAAQGISLNDQRVADTGVGPGIALHELLQGSRPASVVGYDFSAKAVEHASRLLPDARFEVRTVDDVPSERFDVVFCTEVLEHLEDPREGLRGTVELLAPGGMLVLTVPDGRIDFSEKHINFWSPEGWGLFLRQVLPDHEVSTAVFAPYPETGHQTNVGLVRRP